MVQLSQNEKFVFTYGLSCGAACAAEAFTFPLDMIKTRLQSQGEGGAAGARRGLIGTGVGIVKEEGLLKLYKGLTPACLRHCVYSGTRVMTYEFLRDKVLKKDENGRFPLWKGVIAGMLSGAFGQLLASPTDLLKVQMQLDGKRQAMGQTPLYRGTWDCFMALLRQGGVKGLWRGWAPNCQRAALVQLGDLTTYDAAKQFCRFNLGIQDGPGLHALASAFSGAAAATLGAPADVVKTRVMNQPLGPDGRGLVYRGAWHCLQTTVANEGVAALFKGWVPTYLRMAPWSFTFFITFEQLRRVAGLESF